MLNKQIKIEMVTIVNAKMKFVNVGSGVINCGVCFRK